MGFPATAGNQLQKKMESALLIHNPLKWPFNVALSFFPDPYFVFALSPCLFMHLYNSS